jgi:hypothetical protein
MTLLILEPASRRPENRVSHRAMPGAALTPLDAARRSEQDGLDPTALVAWLLDRGAKSASELG